MKDHNHDLIHQLSEDLDSLWRYSDYIKASKGCDNCIKLWKKCKAFDEEKVELIKHEIARHVSEKRFH